MSLKVNSRYLLTEVIRVIDPVSGRVARKPFVDIRQRVTTFASDDRFIRYDTVSGWANLGLKFLVDANAWWVIADLSNIVDPFEELVENAELRAPSVARFNFGILPGDDG